ncbi:hypothetical protein [Streptosporangium roseum]|nr:hypothetical protein [Streptosporangium roseum]
MCSASVQVRIGYGVTLWAGALSPLLAPAQKALVPRWWTNTSWYGVLEL